MRRQLGVNFSWIFLILSVLIFPGLTDAQEACTPAQGSPIVIGAIFPAASVFSADVTTAFGGAEAMRLAINACGGVQGRPVEFAYESANDYDAAAAAVEELVAQDVAVIIGSGLPAVSEGALAAVGQRAVYWEVTESVTASDAWVFSTAAADTQLGLAAGEFIAARQTQNALAESTPVRAALIYEGRRRGQETAVGVQQSFLADHLVLTHRYEDHLENPEGLARELKRLDVNVILVSAFEADAIRLWFAVRQADLALSAWVQIGSDHSFRRLCENGLSGDAVITVSRAGAAAYTYREQTIGQIYSAYRASYVTLFGSYPNAQADLSASGVYLLLRNVLPQVTDEISAPAVRDVISHNPLGNTTGLFGESLSFRPENRVNLNTVAVITQQQAGLICNLSPTAIATCQSMIPFPTWRERAVQEANGVTCSADV